MKLTIQGSAKEIAALVLAAQERREEASAPAINVDELLHHSVNVDSSCLDFASLDNALRVAIRNSTAPHSKCLTSPEASDDSTPT